MNWRSPSSITSYRNHLDSLAAASADMLDIWVGKSKYAIRVGCHALRFGNLLSSFPAAREREPGILILNNFFRIPRCAIAHLRSVPAHHPAITLQGIS